MSRRNLASFIFCVTLLGFAAGCGGPVSGGGGSAVNAPAADSNKVGADTARNNSSGVNAANAPVAPTPGGDAAASNPPPKRGASGAQAAKMPEPQIGSGGNDFFLFTKVRGAIEADGELKGSGIIVNVSNGVVVLSGGVADEARKSRAEQVARGVQGIGDVRNELRISKSAASR